MSDTQKTLDGEEALELTLPDWVDTDVDRADEIEDRLEDEVYTAADGALHASNMSIGTSQGGLSLRKMDRSTDVLPMVSTRVTQAGVVLDLMLDDQTTDRREGSAFVGDADMLLRPDEARELITRLKQALEDHEQGVYFDDDVVDWEPSDEAESGGDE